MALKDWSETELKQEEFDALRKEVLNADFPKFNAVHDEIITRACHLLFALVESGGLCVNQPQRILPKIKLNRRMAVAGYLNQPVGRKKEINDLQNGGPEKNDAVKTAAADETGEEVAVRQPLHLLGANQLLSFTYYRRKIDEALEGDLLLPELPSDFKYIKSEITLDWLSDFKGVPVWSRIFDYWLKKKIALLRKEKFSEIKVSWNDVKEIALWRLLEKERFPLAVAYRQRKVTTTNLPESKMQRIFAGASIGYEKSQHLFKEKTEGADLITGDEELPGEFKNVREYLDRLIAEGCDREKVITEIDKLLSSGGRKAVSDTKHTLEWFLQMLQVKKLSLQTVYSYGQIVVRFLEELYPVKFHEINTSDVAGYIDNTCGSPNTIKNVRGTLKRFTKFLKNNKLPAPSIEWNSKTLKAFEQGRERDVLTEEEYQKIRKHLLDQYALDKSAENLKDVILLTLLRRCGLRIGEVSWLTAEDFWGMGQMQLKVPRSKTKTGAKRLLPLYLLLDAEELSEVNEFIKQIKGNSSTASTNFLFEENEKQTAAAKLGVRAERILRKAGFRGETAHGLRHALATSLFALLYLETTTHLATNRFTEVLQKFCPPNQQTSFIKHPYHIQLILGHADLFVTFDRYIHLVEIAVWHLVENTRLQPSTETLSPHSVANILRKDHEHLKIEWLKQNLPDEINLVKINDLLLKRIRRLWKEEIVSPTDFGKLYWLISAA